MMYLVLPGIALILMALAFGQQTDPLDFLVSTGAEGKGKARDTRQNAVDIKMLTDEPFKIRLKVALANLRARVGDQLYLKLVVFVAAVGGGAWAIKYYLLPLPLWQLFPPLLVVAVLSAVKMLQVYERKIFEASFPNALNLLNGAVSSGESLMHAIIYVGDSMDGPVGREFKLMGQRMRMGQPAEEVLTESCRRFPYGPFYFFVITLRANINRGGQLKSIIKQLSRVMFNSQAIDKKKGAMTAEARMSAKIVASIPFFFLLLMKFTSPENFDFIFSNEAGKPILYYVLGSEVVGIGIIWMLMKKVQS